MIKKQTNKRAKLIKIQINISIFQEIKIVILKTESCKLNRINP
jgi:hypothetical protein